MHDVCSDFSYDIKKSTKRCQPLCGETKKHLMSPKTLSKILDMRNWVGGKGIFSVMSTSHPDGLQPATVSCCKKVFLPAHMRDRHKASGANVFQLDPTLETPDK